MPKPEDARERAAQADRTPQFSMPTLIENRNEPIPQWEPERIVEEAETLVGLLEQVSMVEDFELEDFTRALRSMFQPSVTEKLHFLLGNVERFRRKDEPEEYAAVSRACKVWIEKYNYLRRSFRYLLRREDRGGTPLSEEEKETAYRYIRPLRSFRKGRLKMIYQRLIEGNRKAGIPDEEPVDN